MVYEFKNFVPRILASLTSLFASDNLNLSFEKADQLSDVRINAIYRPRLVRAMECAEIIQKDHECKIIVEPRSPTIN